MIELNLEDILTIVRQAAREAVEEASAEHRAKMSVEVKEAVDKAVADGLQRVGLRPDDPVGTQEDLRWVRDWRTTVSEVRKKGLLTAVGVLVAGVLGALWLGLRALISE